MLFSKKKDKEEEKKEDAPKTPSRENLKPPSATPFGGGGSPGSPSGGPKPFGSPSGGSFTTPKNNAGGFGGGFVKPNDEKKDDDLPKCKKHKKVADMICECNNEAICEVCYKDHSGMEHPKFRIADLQKTVP